jgi:two-component system cell cycle sensor histidine kinase/response regulator CckA
MSLSAIGAEPARVLIVDDERPTRDILTAILGPEGCIVITADSGEEALAIVAAQPIDLILLDILLPGMDGYAFATLIKKNPATRGIPIVIVTALDDRDARMLGLSAGAEDFVTKPVDRAELCIRVRNLLRLKEYSDYHDKYSQMLEGEVGSRAADLVESERLYRSTFDAAPIGIVHVGFDGQWLRMNQRISDLLGYSRDQLRDDAVQALLRTTATAAEVDAFRRMAAGTLEHYVINEKSYQRPDGSMVWARINTSIHRDTEGRAQHLISVVEDITEWRTLEAQVRQASKMDALGQLAAGIAHDFNNLLSVIISYSEMLAEGLKQNDPMRADLSEIRGAGGRAVALTSQLLAFSRQQVLQPSLVNLGEVILGMENILRRLIGANMELSTTGSRDVNRILVDPGQMEQVIMNLVVNARDAMPSGGKVTIEAVDVVIDAKYAAEHVGVKAGPHVRLSVRDTGTGMDRATLARMFEPFFTTKPSGKGTGLGLATVFGIVRQSGGTIWVDTVLGRGTTFEVLFPATAAVEGGRPSSPPQERRLARGSETILVVENEEAVRVLAGTILRRCGYDVLEAQSAGDAFLLCEQHSTTIHLLLTDMVMPRMNGRQLAERLLVIRPEMKVLYMSGYTDDPVMRLGVRDATIAFLQKPITPESLTRKVRQALGP